MTGAMKSIEQQTNEDESLALDALLVAIECEGAGLPSSIRDAYSNLVAIIDRRNAGDDGEDDEERIETCPRCGVSCNDDVTIADHGMCYDCFQKWREGEDDDEG